MSEQKRQVWWCSVCGIKPTEDDDAERAARRHDQHHEHIDEWGEPLVGRVAEHGYVRYVSGRVTEFDR